MKKTLLCSAILLLVLLLSGCLADAETGLPATDTLVKKSLGGNRLTLAQAMAANKKALSYANSSLNPRDLDSFVLAMGEAQIEENYSAQYEAQALAAAKEASKVGGASAASSAAASAMVDAFNSTVGTISGAIASATSSTSYQTGTSSTSGSSTGSTSSTSSGGNSSSSGSSDSGSAGGSDSGSGGTDGTTDTDVDYAALSALSSDFTQYKESIQPYIEAAGADPSAGIAAPDSDLVGLYYSAQAIIQFVDQHTSVKDGDKVLADVGDVMSQTAEFWGLGAPEAEAAYTSILLYYPDGSYADYAEQQLSLITSQ